MSGIIRPVVNEQFTDKAGRTYDIREVAFSRQDGGCRFGEFVTNSHPNLEIGMNIYKDFNDSNIGYRIAKDLVMFRENFEYHGCYGEARMIAELKQRQPEIELTKFPTGVVTIDGYVVGQEMPFYEQHKTLYEFSKSLLENDFKNILLPEAYLGILQAMKELNDNEIFYSDIHHENFLAYCDGMNVDTRIIDFDPMLVLFGPLKEYQREHMQNHLLGLLNRANTIAQIDYQFDDLSVDKPVDDAIEKVLVMREKIK